MRAGRRGAIVAAVAAVGGGTLWLAAGSATAGSVPGAPVPTAVHQQAAAEGSMDMSEMAPGAQVWVEGEGFAAGAQVEMRMDGGLLGTATADAAGRVRFEWELDARTSVGDHMMTLTGTGLGGGIATLSAPVAVGAGVGSQAGGADPAQPVPSKPSLSG